MIASAPSNLAESLKIFQCFQLVPQGGFLRTSGHCSLITPQANTTLLLLALTISFPVVRVLSTTNHAINIKQIVGTKYTSMHGDYP
jgi:hypothetical protein